MAPSEDALVLGLGRPGSLRGQDWDSVVSPVSQERDGRMVDPFQSCTEIGATAEVTNEVFPRLGRGEITRQVTH